MENKKGFTLLEILVVVLIIGILAAIALPQYQMAVGKARFSTLKNLTKSIQQSVQGYYMGNDSYPHSSNDLDIGLNIKSETEKTWGLEITMKNDTVCTIWLTATDYIACKKKIFGEDMLYYVNRNTGVPLFCIVSNTNGPNAQGRASRLCAQETNKPVKSSCGETTCQYNY